MSDEAKTNEEVFEEMDLAVARVKETKNLTLVLVLALGHDGYITSLRPLGNCESRDLREAAGFMLGFANRLAKAADVLDGDDEDDEDDMSYAAPRQNPGEKPS